MGGLAGALSPEDAIATYYQVPACGCPPPKEQGQVRDHQANSLRGKFKAFYVLQFISGDLNISTTAATPRRA